MKKRTFYYAAALLFFIWENYAAVRWASRFDSIGAALSHTLHAMTEDWMTLLILQDAGVFTILVISWLILDTRRRGVSGRQRWGWLALTVLVGSPAVLIYLGRRSCQRIQHSTNPA
jgi:hypothetical protein